VEPAENDAQVDNTPIDDGPIDKDEEGWFTDPFGRHEARWLSYGRPTKLVRDGGVESYDEPPEDEEPARRPERVEEEVGAINGADLRRADDGEGELTDLGERMGDAALEGGAHPQVELP
jgi:hypothetical protein